MSGHFTADSIAKPLSKDCGARTGWSWGVPQIRNALPAVRPAQPTCSSQGQKIGPNREAAFQ